MLSRHAEFVATFVNEDEEPEPRLGQCCMQEGAAAGCSEQAMRPLWCIQELPAEEAAEAEEVQTEGSGGQQDSSSASASQPSRARRNSDDQETQLNCRMCYESFHRNSSLTTTAATTKRSAPGASSEGTATLCSLLTCEIAHRCTFYAVSAATAEGNIIRGGTVESTLGSSEGMGGGSGDTRTSKLRRRYRYQLTECAPTQVTELELDSWKDLFSGVWEMKCAVPAPLSSPRLAGLSSASASSTTSTSTTACACADSEFSTITRSTSCSATTTSCSSSTCPSGGSEPLVHHKKVAELILH